jgi:hypothetical protein
MVLMALCCVLASALSLPLNPVAANEPLAYCKRDCEIRIDSCNDTCNADNQRAMLNRQMSRRSNPGVSAFFQSIKEDVKSLSEHGLCRSKCSAVQEKCEFKCEATYGQK